ncbi:hypothetical protein C8J56DRAFT_1019909 [Mycena floridula]|nr:hypothetical protein C8J56DRAFT_1019909 [Mycena floridula]
MWTYLSFFLAVCSAQFHSERNFYPGGYPLAVKSPYLNAWEVFVKPFTPSLSGPSHWNGFSMGWTGWIRVDGISYPWFGNGAAEATTLISSQVTPTRTIFTVQAGPILLNVTFLSPIEPSDLVKQSFPFVYLSVDFTSTDNTPHSIQLYSDTTAEWLSGQRSTDIVWNTTLTQQGVFHQATPKTPQFMQETDDIAGDSTVYYAMRRTPETDPLLVHWQTGSQADLHVSWTDSSSTAFTRIDDSFPAFAISKDFGITSSSTSPAVWALGIVRDPVIQYQTASSGLQNRSSYFWSQYGSISDAIDDFLVDYDDASARASALDEKLLAAASSISLDYSDVIALGARQTLAGVDWTISRTSFGWNMSDSKAFMRQTGDSRRVNAVETLYASFPAFLYLNASWAGMLLDPLLEYASSSLYPNRFSAPDLGSTYPLASGNSSTESVQSIQDTGNMLFMTLAHATYSGDGRLLQKYNGLLTMWSEYLIDSTMIQSVQFEDEISGTTLTNVILTGIVGIRCMSSISKALGFSTFAESFSSTAASYAAKWLEQATLSGHLLSTYDPSSEPALIYGLYPDRLLNLSLIDDLAYKTQNAFYQSEVSTAPKYGLPYVGLSGIVKAPWTTFTAATTTDVTTRNALISMVRSHANYNLTNIVFSATYDSGTGSSPTGQASPAQGGLFALLAQSLPVKSFDLPTSSSLPNNATSKKSKTGAIAGSVVGSVLALAATLVLAWLIRHRRRKTKTILDTKIPRPYASIPALAHDPEADNIALGIIPSPESLQPSISYSQEKGTSVPETRLNPPTITGTSPATERFYSPSGGTVSSPSSSDRTPSSNHLLREVENLRREVEDLRALRENDLSPPEYDG